MNDPSQLLQRIPELEPLAAEPRIRRAIEGGDPFKVYRALFVAKWLRRLPQHQDTLKALLRQRRLFARPLRGTPGLGTFNSIGFGFVGESERAEGAYVTTHAFVMLFGVPLFPLGAYLVSRQGNGYRIFARVPMGALGWGYTRGIGVALLAALLFGVGHAAWDSGHQDLVVLNGFDQPVSVQVGGKTVTVAASGRETINLAAGEAKLAARLPNGFVVDELVQKIDPEANTAVWNIAGAAPLMFETVVYSKDASIAPEGNPEIFCGKHYIEPPGADYEFEQPPKQLSAREQEKSLQRSHLDVAVVPGMTQSEACANYLVGQDRMADAASLLRGRAVASGYDSQQVGLAAIATKAQSAEQAAAFARAARDAKPADVDLQRLYQTMAQQAGQSAQVQGEYDGAARAHPDSAAAQYLDAVLLQGEPGIARLDELSRRFDEPYILRSLVWREWANGHHERAAGDWDRLLAKSPAAAGEVVDAKVGAELALHRVAVARDAIEKAFAAAGGHDPAMASMYALLAAQTGGDGEALFSKVAPHDAPDAMVDYFRVRAGLKPVHGGDSPMAAFAAALRIGGNESLAAARKLAPLEMLALPGDDWMLAFGEAVRTGDQELAGRLRLNSRLEAVEIDRLHDFALGRPATLDGLDIDPLARSAASLIRSRNAALPAGERDDLRRVAVAGDLLHTAVSIAAQKWTD